MEQGNAGTDFWYGETRRAGVRALSEEERKKLLWERVTFRVIAVIGGVALPVLFLFSLVAVLAMTDRTPGTQGMEGAGRYAPLLTILPTALLVVFVNYLGRKSTGLKKDLAGGYVNRYAIGGDQIEVLPFSHRVLTANGRPRAWFRAPRDQEELAAPPGEPAEAPQPAGGGSGASPMPAVTVRALTDAERDELRRLARKQSLGVVPGALLANVWLWSVLVYALRSQGLARMDLRFLFVGLLAVVALLVLIGGVVQFVQLREDLKDGRLLPLHVNGVVEERLAVSQTPWTVNGQPAQWRRRPKEEGRVYAERVGAGLARANQPPTRAEKSSFRQPPDAS
jgi:hypothetical protein